MLDRFRTSPTDRAIAWAMEVAADRTTVYLDTETTGLGAMAEICELAILDWEGKIVLDTLVKPLRGIPDGASRIHGIFDEDVANAWGWNEVFPVIQQAIEGRRVIVYNASYDRGVVDQVNRAAGVPFRAPEWGCAMLAFADFRAITNPRGTSMKWHKLEEAVRYFGGEPGGHRAAADAYACRLVIEGMAGKG